ncbi:hypothetical protein RND71_032237 [Anisodus tanguticus]|uniref:Uncharacterized protein n=1 Tax=Anisodus tanguticus TaxID=243964 RepID=A0AAE1RET8_9SOLA|nr:hypothetical protein RND71_032237 [Anisodus tanguticus]
MQLRLRPAKIVLPESKLSAVCERVLDRCLAPTAGGEGCDNMTMILVQFKKPILSGSSPGDEPLASSEKLPASGASPGDESSASPGDEPSALSEKFPASVDVNAESKPVECGSSS